ncbi:MAG: outer membrane lipoprotein-sorting protein, partial [Treponema sp.]|nr:outer membrane lipoprotein-sorting protein [Treponema sp.]
YIRKDVPLTLKEEDFSGSGRLMRTILLPKYTKVPAGYVPTQIILKDELNPGENTQQNISDLTFDALPNKIFTKAYLEGLN